MPAIKRPHKKQKLTCLNYSKQSVGSFKDWCQSCCGVKCFFAMVLSMGLPRLLSVSWPKVILSSGENMPKQYEQVNTWKNDTNLMNFSSDVQVISLIPNHRFGRGSITSAAFPEHHKVAWLSQQEDSSSPSYCYGASQGARPNKRIAILVLIG